MVSFFSGASCFVVVCLSVHCLTLFCVVFFVVDVVVVGVCAVALCLVLSLFRFCVFPVCIGWMCPVLLLCCSEDATCFGSTPQLACNGNNCEGNNYTMFCFVAFFDWFCLVVGVRVLVWF